MYCYIGSLLILANTYTTALATKQIARKVLFLPCLIEHIPLSQIKMTYTKNARTKQVLQENGYQESIIGKIFKRITNDHSFSQSQQQMQVKDIQEEESSNINEGIKAVLFFNRKDFTRTKSTKSTKSTKRKQASFTQTFFTRIKSTKSTKRQTSNFLLLRCFLCA